MSEPSNPPEGSEPTKAPEGTPKKLLAKILVTYWSKQSQYPEMDEHRINYEKKYGRTDLTKHYTSMWSEEDQRALIGQDIKAWFDGLPAFFKSYLKMKMRMISKQGNLDDTPDNFIQLYVSGGMVLDHEKKQHGR